jgi:hypothetical protein
VAVERHGIRDAQQVGVGDQTVLPPSAADDVEVQIGQVLAQAGDGVERVLDLLVRHQPRQHDYPRRRRLRLVECGRGRLVESVAHDRDAVGVHPEIGQVARRGQGHRDVLVAPVQPRRHRRLDEPSHLAHQPPGHRPQLAVAVVHQHRHPSPEGEPGHEGQSVLGVDHHVGPRVPQRAEPDAGQHHRQARPDVDGVRPTGPVDPHAVDDLAPLRTRIACGAQRHPHPGRGQLRADALKIRFAAAALGVTGVAPAQQQH